MPRTENFNRTVTEISGENQEAQITFRNGRHSFKPKSPEKGGTDEDQQLYTIGGETRIITPEELDIFKAQQERIRNKQIIPEGEIIKEYMPGISKKGVEAAEKEGGKIAREVLFDKYDIVIFAGISNSERTRSTALANINGLKEGLDDTKINYWNVNLSTLFANGYDKSFANMRNQLKQARIQIAQAIENGIVPIIDVPVELPGDKMQTDFGGGEEKLKDNGYLGELISPIVDGGTGGEAVMTHNYLENKGLDKTGRSALPDPRVIAFQQKYIESRIQKILKLLLPSSSRALVVNTSHGVLTDVSQVTALNPENPNAIGGTTETIINENESVIVSPNGEITYRKAQGLQPKSQSEILMASLPNFIQEDLSQLLGSDPLRDRVLNSRAVIDYFSQMEKVNANLATKIFKLAKYKLRNWHPELDLDQFKLESFADVRAKSQEQNPNNKSETLWRLEQEFGKAVLEIIKPQDKPNVDVGDMDQIVDRSKETESRENQQILNESIRVRSIISSLPSYLKSKLRGLESVNSTLTYKPEIDGFEDENPLASSERRLPKSDLTKALEVLSVITIAEEFKNKEIGEIFKYAKKLVIKSLESQQLLTDKMHTVLLQLGNFFCLTRFNEQIMMPDLVDYNQYKTEYAVLSIEFYKILNNMFTEFAK